MAQTRLYLDTRTLDKNGQGTLRLILSQNRTQTSLSLGIRLAPEEWSGGKVVGRPDKDTLNIMIQKRKADIDMLLFRLESSLDTMPRSAKELMEVITTTLYPAKKPAENLTFMGVSERVIARKSGTTKACYKQAIGKMLAYDPSVSVKEFDDLDHDWFEGFVAFLDGNMSWNGSRNYLRCIRVLFNEARELGICHSNPFRKIDMRPAPTVKRSLSLEDLRTIRTMELAPWQEEYRDMFMLMVYLIGINAVDLFHAKPEQIINGRLEYVRTKTRNSSKEQYSVKIEPEAMAIIEKYRGEKYLLSPCERYNDYKCYVHHMNDALQTFGRNYRQGTTYTGRPKFPQLTTYWARHSWSTLAYELGFSVDIIGQGLGHRDNQHRITMVYIKPDQRKVDEANRAVIDAITK